MSKESLKKINPYLDAANVDLKSFSENHYRKICGGRLKFVLQILELIKELGIWLEVTTLLIPTFNDSEGELKKIAEFILHLGRDTPWHVSRFYPSYRMMDLPPASLESLHRARQIGLDAGLRYVYTGNVPGDEGENTYCYQCRRAIIVRDGYHIKVNHIQRGLCEYCKAKIDGVGLQSRIV
jgi:pyruvate formate lyase activating enzyme